MVSSCGRSGTSVTWYGLIARRDRRHFFGRGHFDVQPGRDGLLEQFHVAVLDVTAVTAQVDGDPLRTRHLGEDGCGERFGLVALARFAQRRDVVDVDG